MQIQVQVQDGLTTLMLPYGNYYDGMVLNSPVLTHSLLLLQYSLQQRKLNGCLHRTVVDPGHGSEWRRCISGVMISVVSRFLFPVFLVLCFFGSLVFFVSSELERGIV